MKKTHTTEKFTITLDFNQGCTTVSAGEESCTLKGYLYALPATPVKNIIIEARQWLYDNSKPWRKYYYGH